MKKISKYFILFTIMLITIFACNKKKTDNTKNNTSQDTATTKVVQLDNYQVAFDLLDQAAYDEMMKKMKSGMHKDDVEHYISITIVDKEQKKLIEDAKVKLNINDPEGTSLSKMAMAMSSDGMFHYGAVLDVKKKGEYKIAAIIKINGTDYNVDTNFSIN